MIWQDLAVVSHRRQLKIQIEALLGHQLEARWNRMWSAADVFGLGREGPALVILDVLRLFASAVTFLPRMTPFCPGLLVVGLREDSSSLTLAWNEDIPAYPVDWLTPRALRDMAAQDDTQSEFRDLLGLRNARRVHAFLARRLEEEILSGQERAIVGLIRVGYRNARIGRELGIQEKTVKNHVSSIFSKLGVSNRYELIARSSGLSSPRTTLSEILAASSMAG